MTRFVLSSRSLPLLAVVLLQACVSLDTAAPPVATLRPAAAGGGSIQLDHGRTIYITKCAKCHAPEPVRNYSAARWREIIPEMAEETKLSSAETEALRAYVFAVLGGS
jgi:mono/diheme cytochrome c family protein